MFASSQFMVISIYVTVLSRWMSLAAKREARPSEYKCPRSVAQLLQIMLSLTVALSLIVVMVDQYAIFCVLPLSQKVDAPQVLFFQMGWGLCLILQFILFCITGCTFVVWMRRIRRNLDVLGVTGLKSKPDDAIGAFLIPVVSLFKPFSICQELWRANAPDIEPGQSWEKVKGSRLISWWWALWLFYCAFDRLAFKLGGDYDLAKTNPDQLAQAFYCSSACEIVGAVSALLSFFIVQQLTRRHVLKRALSA